MIVKRGVSISFIRTYLNVVVFVFVVIFVERMDSVG